MRLTGFKPDQGGDCAMAGEEEAFDRAFRRRSARLDIRPEQPDDFAFVQMLAARCSPLSDLLPAPLLVQQSAAQEAAHRAQYPGVMRRIVSISGLQAGRIVVEWATNGVSHGVDIAVLPEFRSSGAGLLMLRAWLEAADSSGCRCTLHVRRDNPAVPLYRRLGFASDDDAESSGLPFIGMIRAARPSAAIAGAFFED